MANVKKKLKKLSFKAITCGKQAHKPACVKGPHVKKNQWMKR